MTQKDNIVSFPLKKRMEQVHHQSSAVDEDIEAMIDDVASDVLAFLADEGFDIADKEYMYSISYFVESLRSMVFHMHDEPHPFRDMAITLYENVKYDNPEQLEFDF